MGKTFKSFAAKARDVVTSDLVPHGGQIRFPGPFPRDDGNDVDQMLSAVESGMQALRDGTSPFAADLDPVGEPEIVEYFDVFTGEYVVNWFVPCKERRAATKGGA
jgi:hypothetical protein